MKTCPKCNAQMEDAATFCTNCGAPITAAQPAQETFQQQPYQQAPQQQYQQPVYAAPIVAPFDHTAEFDPKDISEHKVFAMLCYLSSLIGILLAVLVGQKSDYTMFHVRQACKFLVVELLTMIAISVLCWTVIVPIVGGIFIAILYVIKIIAVFQIGGGKAVEPAIIRGMGFLK